MRYISLFTGIGGFELGIQQAYESIRRLRSSDSETRLQGIGGEEGRQGEFNNTGSSGLTCVGYSEIERNAITIYQRHFPEHTNYGDITKIAADTLPEFDLLVGGFPCQAFSVAGKRRGFDDTRGTLFFDIARILKSRQPRLLLLENVKGLLSHDNGRTFKTIIATLTELGYDCQWQVLNSKNFGVPQNRERVFIVGHLRGEPRPQVFPFGQDDRKIDEVRATNDGQERDSVNSEGEIGWPTERRKVSQCIDTNYWKGIDNHKQRTLITKPNLRRLTPLECERLQGFPDGWTEGVSDTNRYKCLGNAVTVNVIQAIMEKIL